MSGDSLQDLIIRLGHDFARPELLTRALTHASASGGKKRRADYERLEFLGDRVLGLVVADMLMKAYPKAAEGELASRFNALVRRETCADAARALDLGSHLVLGNSEAQAGGRTKEAILADACEAVIAAIYRDGGFEAAEKFIKSGWRKRIEEMDTIPSDPKTSLQEWAQARGKPAPDYVEINRTGPDHSPEFTIEVQVKGLEPETGRGKSKRSAEQEAAEAMLIKKRVWKKKPK